MRALLTLFLLLSPAYAEDTPSPPSVNVTGMTPVQYNDLIAGMDYAMGQQLAVALGAAMRSNDPAAFETWRLQTIQTLTRDLGELRRVPPYKGDSALIDTTIKPIEWFVHALELDLAELSKLMTKTDVVNGDLDRAELLVKRYTEEAKRLVDEQRAAQVEFAKKHRFLLVYPEVPPLDSGPVFVAPHLVPEGSGLTAEQHISFNVRYANHLLARQNALVDVLNRFLTASASPDFQCSEARQRAVAELELPLLQARAVGDWRGDKALFEATVAFGALVEEQLNDDYARYCAAVEAKRPKASELNEANRVAEAANVEMQRSLAGFNTALQGFYQRWGVHEYEAWVASVGG